jgi:hypothetical protein
MQANLLKLQKDPASPCGQAIQDAGIKPAPKKSGGGGGRFAGMSALKKINQQAAAAVQQAMAQSATAVAAANAARALQEKQAEDRKKQQAEYKKKRLLAFTAKLNKRQALIEEKAAESVKVRAARSQIMAKSVARPAGSTRGAELASAKAGQAVQKKVPQSKALAMLNQNQRAAFAREWGQKKAVPKKGAAGGGLSADQIAKRQARMAKRLANVAGMNDQQKKAFVVAYAKARAQGRADMLKSAPVSRTSVLGQAPAGQEAADPPDRAAVNTKMLRQLKTLKALAQ